VSLGLYPPSESYALLARMGVTGVVATTMLYGAALLDIALGVGVFVLRDRRWLWAAQIAVMLAYTVLISIWLPEWWLHPYGPMIKNVPLLVATMLLAVLESRRWTT
jgi:ABC-type amino acid transport system permease subunit